MWFQKILVRFFMSIDKTLYNFITTLYDLLIAISRTSVLTQGDIAQFATRIEILLGIFMLFKLSFSLITYIVNPDDFTDKQKGFGKLVQNSVISLTMLVLVPYIFQMAFSLQAKVLNDNLLAKLLLGEKITEADGTTDSKQSETDVLIDDAGEELAFMVMLPLFSPNIALTELIPCSSLYSTNNAFNEECERALKENVKDKNDNAIENYKYGIEKYSIGLTFRTEMALMVYKYDGEKFLIDYKYPLSTAVAVITCLLLITFCIDIGVRSVKLAFLQLIYPIPVISFMDPKSGKDGIFSKWYKMCLSTFLSLFIRLLALYFGIYVIMRVGRHGMVDIINGSEVTNGWIKLFIVIGILMFVKQMPKILENLGIKLDGDGSFSLNPLKKVMDEKNGAFGAKRLASAAGGFAVGAMHGRALRGLASGAMSGKGFGDAAKTEADHVRRLREARMNGSTWHGRLGARFAKATGFGGAEARVERQVKHYENENKDLQAKIAPTERRISENTKASGYIEKIQDRGVKKVKQGNGVAGQVYKDYLNNADGLLASKATSGSVTVNGKTYSWSNDQERGARASELKFDAETYANTTGRDAWVNANLATDDDLRNNYSAYVAMRGAGAATDAAGLDADKNSLTNDNFALEQRISEDREKIADNEQKIKDLGKQQRITQADKSAIGK